MLSDLYAPPSKKASHPCAAKMERDALSLLCRDLGLSQPGRRLVLLDSQRLAMQASATPEGQLAMIAAIVLRRREMTVSIEGGRLSALVAGLINMNPAESKLMTLMAGQASSDSDQSAEAFHTVLLEVIRSQRLHRLFTILVVLVVASALIGARSVTNAEQRIDSGRIIPYIERVWALFTCGFLWLVGVLTAMKIALTVSVRSSHLDQLRPAGRLTGACICSETRDLRIPMWHRPARSSSSGIAKMPDVSTIRSGIR